MGAPLPCISLSAWGLALNLYFRDVSLVCTPIWYHNCLKCPLTCNLRNQETVSPPLPLMSFLFVIRIPDTDNQDVPRTWQPGPRGFRMTQPEQAQGARCGSTPPGRAIPIVGRPGACNPHLTRHIRQVRGLLEARKNQLQENPRVRSSPPTSLYRQVERLIIQET